MLAWVLYGAGIAAAVLLLAAAALAVYVARTWDRTYDALVPPLRASADLEVIERGRYLVYGPAHCVECHTASWAEYQEVIDGRMVPLRGGMPFPAPPLGIIYSRNLTPDPETGIGRYTDAQIVRMMRYSIRPDGRASPQLLMPFHNMSDQDLVAVLSFLRAQPAVRHEVPANEFTLVGKVIKSVTPIFKPRERYEVLAPEVSPAEATTKERGEYLARYVANCVGCHTPRHPLTFAPTGPEFSGGGEMEPAGLPGADPEVWYRVPNITPGEGSALQKFPDRATFVARFKVGGRQHPGSPMPWEAFAMMSKDDLGALYEFLHSLPPAAGPSGDPAFRRGR